MPSDIQAYPPAVKRVSGKKLPKDVLDRLRALKFIGKTAPRAFDCIGMIEKITKAQIDAQQKPVGPRKKKTDEDKKKKKSTDEPQSKIVTYRALQELREGLADYMLDAHGLKVFLPILKKGGRRYITTGWSLDESIHRFVTVTDGEERDVAGWNQERVYKKDGETHVIAMARDFFEVAKRNARLIRVWLPSIGIAVVFTPTGRLPGQENTEKAAPVVFRGGHREYRCYPLKELWKALGVNR